MTKKHSIKGALITSILALVVCLSMFVGTTFAWFTDSVTSANNVIKAGNLDVEMYYAEATEDPTDDTIWADASQGAIFSYDNWEPGYVDAKHIKIENEGSLAFKYKVNIIANGGVSDLADVIDVYYVDPAVQLADRTALTDENKLGTLSEVLVSLGASGNGVLKAGEKDTITLALKMQDEAGNDYMNKSIGASFAIQVLATQYTTEVDSFDDLYDDGVEYPTKDFTTAEGGAFMAMLQTVADNSTIYLEPANYGKISLGGGHFNATLPKNITIVGVPGSTISLAVDQTLSATVPFDGVMDSWTFKNVNFTGDGFRLQNGAQAKNLKFEGCTFEGGATFYSLAKNGGKVEGAIFDSCSFTDTVDGSSNKNAISIQDAKDITVNKCTFTNVRNAVNFGSSAKGEMVITNNVVNGGSDRALRLTHAGATYTVKNNVVTDAGDNGEMIKVTQTTDKTVFDLSGNTWNGKTDEEMRFNSNGADLVFEPSNVATEEVAGGESVTAGNVTITLDDNSDEGSYTVKVGDKDIVKTEDGETLSLNIDLLKDGVKVEKETGVEYTVTINVGKDVIITGVTHNGNAVENYDYDIETGVVTFTTDSFSPFSVSYFNKVTKINSAEDLINALGEIRTSAKTQIPGETGNKKYRENAIFVLANDIVVDENTAFMYTDSNGAPFHFYGVKGILDLNGHSISVSADALLSGKAHANAVLLFQYSNVEIIDSVGTGSIQANNKSIPVYAWANCTVDIYGGTFVSNAYERNESLVYVNNATALVNVYGGNYMSGKYAFNVHDNCGTTTTIILHEGITYAEFLKSGTTDVIASDINKGRIAFEEGCELSVTEADGAKIYEVVKK